MLLYGFLNFLMKVVDEKRCNLKKLLVYYYFTAATIAIAAFFLMGAQAENLSLILFFAVIQVMPYLVSNVLKLESLKHIKSLLAYPVFALHGLFTIFLALAFLGETLSIIQWVGVAVSIIALFLLVETKGHIKISKGIAIALLAAILLAISEILTKVAVPYVNMPLFIGFAYFTAIVPSFILEKHLHKRGGKNEKDTVKYGIIMGITNVIAFFSPYNSIEHNRGNHTLRMEVPREAKANQVAGYINVHNLNYTA